MVQQAEEFALPDGEWGSLLSPAEGGPAEGERPPLGPPALHGGRGAASQLRRWRFRVLRKVACKLSPGNLEKNRQLWVNSMYGTNRMVEKTLWISYLFFLSLWVAVLCRDINTTDYGLLKDLCTVITRCHTFRDSLTSTHFDPPPPPPPTPQTTTVDKVIAVYNVQRGPSWQYFGSFLKTRGHCVANSIHFFVEL